MPEMASMNGVQAAGIGPQQGENPSYWVVYFAADRLLRTPVERAR